MRNNLKHEYGVGGTHRIADIEKGEAGEWAGYQGIAAYFDDDLCRTFIAVTGYHGSESPANGSCVRPGIVYLITPQAHVEDEEPRHNYLVEEAGHEPVIMKLITQWEADNVAFTRGATVTRIE